MNVQQTMVDVHRTVLTPLEVLYARVWLDIDWVLIVDHATVRMSYAHHQFRMHCNPAFLNIMPYARHQ